MSAPALQILAGERALARIRTEGFSAELFDGLVGASGGPKWFVLSRLDRMLAGRFFAGRREPIACLGSSIGSWRHACYAQREPVQALERLEHSYIHQSYSARPDQAEVSGAARNSIDYILGQSGAQSIVDNPVWQTHILAVRSKWPTASDSRLPLALGLGACALGNTLSRQLLVGFFQRILFHTGADAAFCNADFAPATVPLNNKNVAQAILASGSIPLVMEGVRNIPGAAPGIYRDGGITDYHFDFSFRQNEGLLLYPHFYSHITPGWYDKGFPWRQLRGNKLANVVMLAPTAEFVARLPFGKIPDRSDFQKLSEQDRISYWTRVCELSECLANEFYEAWQRGKLPELAQKLP